MECALALHHVHGPRLGDGVPKRAGCTIIRLVNHAHNERIKLTANALNNLGVAAIVTAVIAPSVAFVTGTIVETDPLRLLSLAVMWLAVAAAFFFNARRVLGALV